MEQTSGGEKLPIPTENNPHKKAWFSEVCREHRLEITEKQLDQIEEFIILLLEWNKKVNLISRKDEKNIWRNHILHCASILFHLSFPHGARIIDIGTGGGFPGIPLKILQPDLQVTLLDSIEKKVNAVKDIVKKLSIPGILVERGRVEELVSGTDRHHQYDIAIARAVAPLKTLVSWSRPILSNYKVYQNGLEEQKTHIKIEPPALLAMKGGNLAEELQGIQEMSGIRAVQTIHLAQNKTTENIINDKNVIYVSFNSRDTQN